ncbi:MAG: Txe/YoeB family addiction module toxin [Thiotrichaceae bacterium]|nr:Txe/YoeB family addiction module toxin [Thiotrichaceae bacterium]
MKNKKTQNKQQTKAAVLLSWSKHAWEDYLSWQAEDKKIVDEINALIEECLRDPFKGTGKPEPLRGDLTGFWSRRITKEHRLVYLPEGGTLYIVACRYHYTQL